MDMPDSNMLPECKERFSTSKEDRAALKGYISDVETRLTLLINIRHSELHAKLSGMEGHIRNGMTTKIIQNEDRHESNKSEHKAIWALLIIILAGLVGLAWRSL